MFSVNGSNTAGGNVGLRILAGMTTGAAAVLIAQPTDVVKVRMQAQGSGVARYSGTVNAYRTIATQEGVKGLWKGMLKSVQVEHSHLLINFFISYSSFNPLLTVSNYDESEASHQSIYPAVTCIM